MALAGTLFWRKEMRMENDEQDMCYIQISVLYIISNIVFAMNKLNMYGYIYYTKVILNLSLMCFNLSTLTKHTNGISLKRIVLPSARVWVLM